MNKIKKIGNFFPMNLRKGSDNYYALCLDYVSLTCYLRKCSS